METENFDTFSTGNNFQYSALEMDSLGATEYTLVNILVDESGSVCNFATELNACLDAVVGSCEKHPRSQNLLVRTAAFSTHDIREIHGFSTVDAIDKGTLTVHPSGLTPLWDATLDSIETLGGYADILHNQDYFSNGMIFVITDGDDTSSNVANMAKIKDAVNNLRTTETLESIKMILIGVNDKDSGLKAYLEAFKVDAGFDEYISMGDVDAGKLAFLADWMSKSISSTSQALGTGGASKAVNFTL